MKIVTITSSSSGDVMNATTKNSGNESLSEHRRKKQAVKAGIEVGAEATQKRAIWSKERKVAKKCKVLSTEFVSLANDADLADSETSSSVEAPPSRPPQPASRIV